MGVRTQLQEMFNPAMIATVATTKLPVGQIAAAASWTNGTTITMSMTLPAWVVSGMPVFDVTNGFLIGTVSSGAGTTTLTLGGAAAHASSGSADVLQFGFTPSDIAVGAAAGDDIQGMVDIAIQKCNEAAKIVADLQTVITSTQDSTLNTLLGTIATAL